jgi:hypothetical protein
MSSESFQSRLLYKQSGLVEDGVQIASKTYAVSWTYTGATSQTTTRIRTTCIFNQQNDESIIIHSGLIEQWKSNGWIMMEEYYDDRVEFATQEEFSKRLFEHAQSFLMGIPIKQINSNYVEETKKEKKVKLKKPSLKIINFVTGKKDKE